MRGPLCLGLGHDRTAAEDPERRPGLGTLDKSLGLSLSIISLSFIIFLSKAIFAHLRLIHYNITRGSAVINFIVPTLALLLTFLAAIASFRYLWTRQGIYWAIPFLISLILFYQNLTTLLEAAEAEGDFILSFSSTLPLVLAILWYTLIEAFHFALKTEREYNKYVDQSRKTYNEARFVLLTERRKTRKEQMENKTKATNKPINPTVPIYDFPDDEN